MASRKAGTAPGRNGIDRAELHDAIRAANDRIADMIRGLPDTGVRVPGSEWTVGDTAAHIVIVHRLYTSLVGGGSSPITGRDDWFTDGKPRSPVYVRLQREFSERRGAALADLLVGEADVLLQAASRYPGNHLVRWHFADVELELFTSISLFHALGHGYDIAKALGKKFPISAADARLGLHGLIAILPLFLDKEAARGLTACLALRVRGSSRAFLLIDDGEATVHERVPRRVDCHLSADPASLLLVSLGYVSQWGPIARGKLVAWGRKPWLAMRLTNLFPSPG